MSPCYRAFCQPPVRMIAEPLLVAGKPLRWTSIFCWILIPLRSSTTILWIPLVCDLSKRPSRARRRSTTDSMVLLSALCFVALTVSCCARSVPHGAGDREMETADKKAERRALRHNTRILKWINVFWRWGL